MKSRKKRLTTPVKITNEYLGEGDDSAISIASIEEEIEKLRARRNSTTTDSEEDDESKFALLDSVCPPAEQDVFEVLVKNDIEEHEEKNFKDIDC